MFKKIKALLLMTPFITAITIVLVSNPELLLLVGISIAFIVGLILLI